MQMRAKILSWIVSAVVLCPAGDVRAQFIEHPFPSPATVGVQPNSMVFSDQEEAGSAKARSLDQVITRNAIFYLEINNVGALVESQHLIETLRSFWPFINSTGGTADNGAALERLWNLMGPSLKGAQLAVAGWAPETSKTTSGWKKKGDPLVGVFMKFASPDHLRRLMDKQEEIQKAIQALRGKTSDKKSSDVNITVLDEMLMFTEPGVMDRLLLTAPSTQRLAGDPQFQLAHQRWLDEPLFFYLDLDWVSEMAADEVSKTASSARGEKKQGQEDEDPVSLVRKTFGFNQARKLAVSASFNSTHTVAKALVVEDRAGAGTAKGSFTVLKLAEAGLTPAEWQLPRTNASLTFSIDWVGLYDGIMGIMDQVMEEEQEQRQSFLAMSEAVLGYNLRDELLPALGSELSLSLQSLEEVTSMLDEEKKSPVAPKLTLQLSLRDREVVERALKNLRTMMSQGAAPGAASRPEQINGASVVNMGSFGYAVANEVLILGTDAENLRQVIQGHESGATLAGEPDFVRGTQWMPGRLYAWAFVSPAAAKTFFDGLRKSAVKDEPRLAAVLTRFASPAESMALASWQDAAGIMTELRVPNGLLPIIMAAGIASDRADERDGEIREKISNLLLEQDQLVGVEVTVKRGVVTLAGTVKTAVAKSRARRLIEKIDGVKSVVNGIEVEARQ